MFTEVTQTEWSLLINSPRVRGTMSHICAWKNSLKTDNLVQMYFLSERGEGGDLARKWSISSEIRFQSWDWGAERPRDRVFWGRDKSYRERRAKRWDTFVKSWTCNGETTWLWTSGTLSCLRAGEVGNDEKSVADTQQRKRNSEEKQNNWENESGWRRQLKICHNETTVYLYFFLHLQGANSFMSDKHLICNQMRREKERDWLCYRIDRKINRQWWESHKLLRKSDRED